MSGSGTLSWRLEAEGRSWELSLGWAVRADETRLHPEERARADSFPAAARADGFRLGRTAAKRALGAGADRLVGSGVYGQPTLDAPGELSLSHTKGLAIAVSAPAGLPVGVDVEEIGSEPSRLRALEGQTNETERSLADVAYPDRVKALHGLWSAKEALSKALRTGLSTPFSLLTIGSIKPVGLGRWIEFTHFPQYAVLQTELAGRVASVLLPKRSHGDWSSLLKRLHEEVKP